MTDVEYNGWPNFPTWAIQSWLRTNGNSKQMNNLVATIELDYHDTDLSDAVIRENVILAMAQKIPAYVIEHTGLDLTRPGPAGSLQRWAFQQVRWNVIAKFWVDNFDPAAVENPLVSA